MDIFSKLPERLKELMFDGDINAQILAEPLALGRILLRAICMVRACPILKFL